MEESDKKLEEMAILLEKYRKNKTLVSPEDLAGKYSAQFHKLILQLKKALQQYLLTYSLENLKILQDEYLGGFAADVNRIYSETDMGRRVGKAAFKEFDLEKIKCLAEELRNRIYNEAWVPYFQKHIWLYITEECLAVENPQTPKIYNSLVDMFWNEEKKEWIKEKIV